MPHIRLDTIHLLFLVSLVAVGIAVSFRRVAPASQEVSSVAVSDDGTVIVGGTNSGALFRWGKSTRQVLGHSSAIRLVRLLPKSGIVTADESEVSIWSLDLEPRSTIDLPRTDLLQVVHGGSKLVIRSDQGVACCRLPTLRFWKFPGAASRDFRKPTGLLGLSDDGVLVANYMGNTRGWHIRTGESAKAIPPNVAWLAPAFESGDSFIEVETGLTGASQLLIVNANDWSQQRSLGHARHENMMVGITAFDIGQDHIATITSVGSVILWHPESGDNQEILEASTEATSLSFSSDGGQLAVGTRYGAVRVFNVEAGSSVEYAPERELRFAWNVFLLVLAVGVIALIVSSRRRCSVES